MNHLLKVVMGMTLIVGGLMAVIGPYVSVWRVGADVLDALPETSSIDFVDTRHRTAIFDRDFVLAQRTYANATSEEIATSLVGDGFESAMIGDRRWFIKQCCGDYDSVRADVQPGDGNGTVVVALTTSDTDVQIAVVFLGFLGVVLLLSGVGIMRANGRSGGAVVSGQ